MCKHVAAVLYGIGARLDEQPELLFALRRVDHADLVKKAGTAVPLGRRRPSSEKVLGESGLAEIFGIEMAPALPATRRSRTKADGAGKQIDRRRSRRRR